MSDSGSEYSMDSNMAIRQILQALNKEVAELKLGYQEEVSELRTTIDALENLFIPPQTPDFQHTQDLTIDILAARLARRLVAITSLHTSNAKTVNSAKANCDGASVSLEERPEVKAKERAIVASIEAVENKSRDAGRNYFNTVAEIEELKKLYPREMMQEYLTPELTWLGRVKKAFELRRV